MGKSITVLVSQPVCTVLLTALASQPIGWANNFVDRRMRHNLELLENKTAVRVDVLDKNEVAKVIRGRVMRHHMIIFKGVAGMTWYNWGDGYEN